MWGNDGLGHRLVGAMPAYSELSSRSRDRVADGIDHRGDPQTGQFRRHSPGPDVIQLLGPVLVSQSCSAQRDRRFDTHNTVGRPDTARSLTRLLASVTHGPSPHPEGLTKSAVVSTNSQLTIHHTPGATTNPGHTHQRGGATTTLKNGQDLPFYRSSIRRTAGPPSRVVGLPNQHWSSQHLTPHRVYP